MVRHLFSTQFSGDVDLMMKIIPSATTADVISTSLSIKISLCDVGRISKSIIASSVSELAALADAKIANGKRNLRKSKVDPN